MARTFVNKATGLTETVADEWVAEQVANSGAYDEVGAKKATKAEVKEQKPAEAEASAEGVHKRVAQTDKPLKAAKADNK